MSEVLCLMFKKSLLLLLLLVSNSAFSGLITGTGSYTMTEFLLPGGSNADSATSMDGNIVDFTNINGGSPVSMMVGDNNNSAQNWWDGSDDIFYYADFNTTWVELVMPENTLAFSLAIDAKYGAKAWIVGVADDGNAIDTDNNPFTLLGDGHFSPNDPDFNIHLNGQAQSFGFHANNSASSCNTISKVVIDPNYWAMGDFSIHVDDKACSNKVPEPSIIALFAAGLFGLGFARRRMRT